MAGRYKYFDTSICMELLLSSNDSDQDPADKQKEKMPENTKLTNKQKQSRFHFPLKKVYERRCCFCTKYEWKTSSLQYHTTHSYYGKCKHNSRTRKEEELLKKLSHQKNHIIQHRRQSEFSSRRNYNSNSNNNKKKPLLSRSTNNSKEKVESRKNIFSKPKSVTRRKFTQNNRSQSFQLSSIRILPSPGKQHLSPWARQNVEYGKRIIAKDGTSNVQVSDPEGRIGLYSRYVNDIFTTLLDSSWAWVLSITTAVYIVHWLVFGLIYWVLALLNNDHLKEIGSEIFESENSTASSSLDEEGPCIYQVYDGVTAFLFSLESETTIGYGFRTITTKCPGVVLCLTLQCIVSAVFDTWVIGMCFARLARPDARTKTTLFSKTAVICQRDGQRCLLVRFANLRKSLLLNVSVTGRLITWRGAHSKEKNAGFQRMLEQCQITFRNESATLLTAPIEYCHVIDSNSPLYDFQPQQYNSPNGSNYFEMICIITGTLESTGLTMQAQTSYLSSEVLYGYRFVPVIAKCPKKQKYVANFKAFHDTVKEPSSTNGQKTRHLRFSKSEPLIEEEFSTSEHSTLTRNLPTSSAQAYI